LIELKLIIEADQQFLIQARNQALPKLDAVALYRWNGLEGTTPARTNLSTNGSEYTDWSVGVNFSVPLGLRQGRAAVRQQEFIIARDRANLDQGLHNAVHELATGVRGQAETFEQYKARAEAREAARINLDQQTAEFRSGRAIFLNVLEAITDWGNAVSAEALALTRYNTELANLERTTGTILETHGIHFYEERLGMIGPLGCITGNRYYPSSVRPAPNADRYPRTNEPAENTFDLKSPIKREGDAPEALPKPAEKP
jgi:outer membrane protein TolC